MDGSESGGHAVAIGPGSEVVPPRSRSRTGQGSRGVGSGGTREADDDLAWLGLAGWLSRSGDAGRIGRGWEWDQIG